MNETELIREVYGRAIEVVKRGDLQHLSPYQLAAYLQREMEGKLVEIAEESESTTIPERYPSSDEGTIKSETQRGERESILDPGSAESAITDEGLVESSPETRIAERGSLEYEEGMKAVKSGKGQLANPYDGRSKKGKAWIRGWTDGVAG
jgi:hypothetical protein